MTRRKNLPWPHCARCGAKLNPVRAMWVRLQGQKRARPYGGGCGQKVLVAAARAAPGEGGADR